MEPKSECFADVARRRISRRRALGTMVAGAFGAAGAAGLAPVWHWGAARAAGTPAFGFTGIPSVVEDNHRVPEGYRAEVLIRWGDSVLAGAPAWVAGAADAGAQAQQFGFNNDFIAYLPLPQGGSASDHGLLVVNHEYPSRGQMYDASANADDAARARVEAEMAAVGLSVIEVVKEGASWRARPGGTYARRITAHTPIGIAGPAAGDARLRTAADPSGKQVLGTLNNCGGGTTPWGTVLSAEENFNGLFWGHPAPGPEAANHARLGIVGKPAYDWARHHPRFDVTREPNEPNRFGWIVEVDPYDARSMPMKRTALGRFKHEAATVVVNADGRVTVYSGDDERFQFLYRFVSDGRYDPRERAANFGLLDSGTLSAARFSDDGTVEWLPLVCGNGPLTPGNDFASQADVLIDARRAAALMGATPMDRPEDVETSPLTGQVYVVLTNNANRKPGEANAANPRAANRHGHILELTPPGGSGANADHTAARYRWDFFLLAGDPRLAGSGARYNPALPAGIWLSSPDNIAFDPQGRLWIATDQGSAQRVNGIADGVWGCAVAGSERALPRLLFACPKDAEMCGPAFTPDGRTLFVAVQHPGEHKESSFANPSSRWPDFKPGVPPRPSVVAITRDDGAMIGA